MRKIFDFDKSKSVRILPLQINFNISKRTYWTKQGIRKRKINKIFN